jgi:PAS domain S-box-containing protein
MKIRTKLIFPIVSIFILGSIILAIFIGIRESSQHIEHEKDLWIRIGENLSNSWKSTMLFTGSHNLARENYYEKPLEHEINRKFVRNPKLLKNNPESSPYISIDLEKQVIADGKLMSSIIDMGLSKNLLTLVPMKAETECVTCHVKDDIEVGDVMAIIAITSSLVHVDTQIKSDIKSFFSGIVIIIIIGTLFIYIFTIRMTHPITTLVNRTKLVAKGNLDIISGVKRNDEIGELADSFDYMTENLRDSRNKLKNYSRNLEHKIEEQIKDIRESEKKYRQIIEETSDFIFTTDFQGYCTYINPPGQRFSGYSEEKLIGTHFTDLIHAEWKEQVQLFYQKQIQEHVNETLLEFLMVNRAGEEKWVEQSITLITNGDLITGFQGIVRDKTDRKKVETALSIEKAYLAELIESTPLAIAVWDDQSDIQRINKEFTKLFGYGEEVLGENIDLLLTNEELHEEALQITATNLIGKRVEKETIRIRKDGTAVSVLIICTPVKFNDGKLAFYSIYRDITNRKRAEEALYNANSLKEMLLDVIAHDLKNPAGVISGMSDMMMEELPGNEMLEVIINSCNSLLKVIDNATVLSHVALGEEIKFDKLDLAEVLREIAIEWKPTLDDHGMTLATDLPQKLNIRANPIISEVFKNYISNAVKYASNGKKILINSEEVDSSLTINVKDFGETLPEDKRQAVFTRSVQLEEGEKRGRGLGLAIVKRIADAHNAEVGVKPNKPKGNVFYIKIPIST